jgi:hypothetical protein
MKLLSNIVKEKNKEKFNKILSKIQGIDEKVNRLLSDYFKDDKLFIDNFYAGLTIKFPDIKELNDINLMIEISDYIEDVSNKDKKLVDKLDYLSKMYKISTNRLLQLYDHYQTFISHPLIKN